MTQMILKRKRRKIAKKKNGEANRAKPNYRN